MCERGFVSRSWLGNESVNPRCGSWHFCIIDQVKMELHEGYSDWSVPFFAIKKRTEKKWCPRNSGLIRHWKSFVVPLLYFSPNPARLMPAVSLPSGVWFTAESEHHARHAKAAASDKSEIRPGLKIKINKSAEHFFTSTFPSQSAESRGKSSHRLVIRSWSLIAFSRTRLKSLIRSSWSRGLIAVKNSPSVKMVFITFTLLAFVYFWLPTELDYKRECWVCHEGKKKVIWVPGLVHPYTSVIREKENSIVGLKKILIK